MNFTAAGQSTVLGGCELLNAFSMHVRQIGGSGATWTVVLEGSIDGNAWTTIMTHNDTDGDGAIISTGAGLFPCLLRRIRVVALSLGTATSIEAAMAGTR